MIRPIRPESEPACFPLIRKTFLTFEAPEYPPEGITAFEDFLNDSETIARLDFLGAYESEVLIGVIGWSASQNHICLFFVDEQFQRRGVGKKLWGSLQQNFPNTSITVNSSPYAVPFYRHLGFLETSSEQQTDGIRYTPMRYDPD